jgi:hypothetical protein
MQLAQKNIHFEPQLPIRLDQIHLDDSRAIYVVRDDLLPAGTKQRAILPLLRDLVANGASRMTYASPFAGFAQIALAYGCHQLGIPCTIFSERDPSLPGLQAHPFTKVANEWGATVILVPCLKDGEERATALADSGRTHQIPLGFQCREFQQHFQYAVKSGLAEIQAQLGHIPARAWLPVGSGTLTQAFHKAAPFSMQFCCVNVHVLRADDLRIAKIRALPRVQYFSAAFEFSEQAKNLPPVPSNLHYDAKLWSFVQEHAKDGDLWWNVAR